MDPSRAAQEGGLDVGDVGSDRYHHALGYLIDVAALLGDERTATEAGAKQPHGYALTSLLLHSAGCEAAGGLARGAWSCC